MVGSTCPAVKQDISGAPASRSMNVAPTSCAHGAESGPTQVCLPMSHWTQFSPSGYRRVPQATFFAGSPKSHSVESACAAPVWVSVVAAAALRAEAISFFLMRSTMRPPPRTRTNFANLEWHAEHMTGPQRRPTPPAAYPFPAPSAPGVRHVVEPGLTRRQKTYTAVATGVVAAGTLAYVGIADPH